MSHPESIHSAGEVTREDLEALLLRAAEEAPSPEAGIFGPTSMSWRVSRESAVFLAAGRAALLQLAHPWVASAMSQHSSLLQDPVARFHRTFRVVFTMIFGSVPQVSRAARSLHQLHTGITGELPESVAGYARGSSYRANHVPALAWVHATLIDSAVVAYECVLPQLSYAEKNAYFLESRRLASLFGIPPGALAKDWAGFEEYLSRMCASDELGVDRAARALGRSVLAGAGSSIRPPHWYRALTAEWMPERLRREFGLPFDEAEQRAAARAHRWLPRVYRRLPAALRLVGPYLEARARLASCAPGRWTRRSNRFWMGEPRLPFSASTGE